VKTYAGYDSIAARFVRGPLDGAIIVVPIWPRSDLPAAHYLHTSPSGVEYYYLFVTDGYYWLDVVKRPTNSLGVGGSS
jgi:hypothetical protein